MKPSEKILLQTRVDASVARQLDAMARERGHKRAGYLRHLVETHVKVARPCTTVRVLAKRAPSSSR